MAENKDKDRKAKYESGMKQYGPRYKLPDENDKLIQRTLKAGFSKDQVTDFIKYSSLHNELIVSQIKKKGVQVDKELVFQLKKIGVNVNQITRTLHQNANNFNSNQLNETLNSVSEMIKKIEMLIRNSGQ